MIFMYDLFSDFENLFGSLDAFMQPMTYKDERKCPVCGHTWSDFRRTGRFGCGECYKTFRTPAENTLRQIHSTAAHTGKIPSKSGSELKKKRQYEALKAQLQEAVKNEDYEKAAKLHKQIREMENNK
jgi:protein arginine kinase activator